MLHIEMSEEQARKLARLMIEELDKEAEAFRERGMEDDAKALERAAELIRQANG